MSKKTFTVAEEGTNRKFNLVMSCNSSSIDFNLESKDDPNEKYELKNLTLPALQKKNKIYKQFNSTQKIADIIKNKLEKNNFVLRTGCVLSLKHTNEYDEEELIPFEIRKIGSGSSSKNQNDELNRLRKENQELRAQLEKLGAGAGKAKPQPFAMQTAPPAVKRMSVPLAKSMAPPTSKPTPPPSAKPTPPPAAAKPPIKFAYNGSYIPPSMDQKGNIWERIDRCLKLKKDMQKTLDDIYKRLNQLKTKLDNFVDKTFANNPSSGDKSKALGWITEVLVLKQGFKDVDNYPEIFKKEVQQKNITFNAKEQEKFDDSMILLGKSFPYSLTPYHQKIDNLFILVVYNFFQEKNLRFYKPDEINTILELKTRVMK